MSGELRRVHVVGYGGVVKVRMTGTRGELAAELPTPGPPDTEPCHRCEDRARCVADVGTDAMGRPVANGCHAATSWRQAAAHYAKATASAEPEQGVLL